MRAKRSGLSPGNESWSAVSTWVCCGVMLAAGLIPCVLYATATHRFAWAATLALTLLPVSAIPVYLSLFAGFENLKLYAGSLFMASGLWVMLWSILPDTQGYVRNGLLGSGGFLSTLGILFILLFLVEGRAAGGEPPQDEEAVSG